MITTTGMIMQKMSWKSGFVDTLVNSTDGFYIDDVLDLQSGNACLTLGYSQPEIHDHVANGMKNISYVKSSKGEYTTTTDKMARLLCDTSGFNMVTWGLSGSSAIEAAVHMVDTYYGDKGKIITFTPTFHGATYLCKELGQYFDKGTSSRIKSVPTPQWNHPDDRGFAESKTLAELEHLNMRNVRALLIDTMPWANGVLPWSNHFWSEIRKFCDDYNILMIADDIANCWGRQGYWHGWQKYDEAPDISCLGKALTAGFYPLSATICNQKVTDQLKDKPFLYGHTWQPSMAGIYAMEKASEIVHFDHIEYIEDELKFIGQMLLTKNCIDTYRISGTFMGFDTSKKFDYWSLKHHGLSFGKCNNGSYFINVPLIADDEYFKNAYTLLEGFLCGNH